MSAKRLHSLTAVYLAVLYGVVGVAGESLHYLATDGWGLWSAETGGYYHVHAPDFHGHYHRHAHHRDHSHAKAITSKVAGKSELSIVLTASQDTHRPHACPALVLVSTLKLSQMGSFFTPFEFDTVVERVRETNRIVELVSTLCLCPRGPPMSVVA
jgi:hypothetical protein